MGDETTPELKVAVLDGSSDNVLTLRASENIIGRGDHCEVRLSDPLVSREHGRFERTAGGWAYHDLGSRNGTAHNGAKLSAGGVTLLKAGDMLTVGRARLTVIYIGAGDDPSTVAVRPAAADSAVTPQVVAAPPVSAPPVPAPAAVAPRASAPPFSAPPGPAAPVPRHLRIGRALDNDIVLSDPYVSSYHMEAFLSEKGLHVRDSGSLNGTFVDGKRITEAVVPPEAVIRAGRSATITAAEVITRLRGEPEPSFYSQNPTSVPPLLVGEQLGWATGGGKVILRDIDISVRVGQFIAVVGASGAGKSTLMKLLNGYNPPSSGTLTVAESARSGSGIGYVPQEDILHRDLPLRDAVIMSARIRYPSGTARSVIAQRADEVLAELGLTDHARTPVARLSGGQRKRASVALELMLKPKLLLLDEPTSGLDPASDRRLIVLLRALANSGIGVVLITHAVTNIDSCDTVAFLSPGGYLVFSGTPAEALTYFGAASMAEIYETIESDAPPEEWRSRFEQSYQYRQLRIDVAISRQALQVAREAPHTERRRRGTFFWQLRGLAARYARTLLADRRNVLLLIGQVPVIMLLARLLYSNRNLFYAAEPSSPAGQQLIAATRGEGAAPPDVFLALATEGLQLLFVLAASLVWFGTINAAREICKEAPIWERERHMGIRTLPYVLSKMLVLGVLSLLQTALLVGALVLLWNVPGGLDTGAGLVAIGFLTAISGVAAGLCISAAVPTPDRAVAIVPLAMIPQIMFGGGLIPLAVMGTASTVLSAVVGTRWAYAGFTRLTDRADYIGSMVGNPPAPNPMLEQVQGSPLGPGLALVVLTTAFLVLAVQLVARGGRSGTR